MKFWLGLGAAFAALLALGIAFTFEPPTVATAQGGYRGIGMEHVYNRVRLATLSEANALPEDIPPTEPSGQKSSEVYQNVQILGDVDSNEFLRVMTAMSAWVAPQEQGCAYCHNLENMADDSMYTHKVSRRMLQMTRHINADWKPHVGATGVTCYTCHRGQPVPANIWFNEPDRGRSEGLVGNDAGQNKPAPNTGLASLPYDPFTPFIERAEMIRVTSPTALPEGNRSSIKQTEWTYGLMMHMSNALGVNCTFCHNSRQFADWSQSTPQRVTSWHGLRMVHDLNVNYLDPLQPVYPPERLGSLGDAPKANCTTCHQGVSKPLLGVSLLAAHPAFAGPSPEPAPAGAAAPPVDGGTPPPRPAQP